MIGNPTNPRRCCTVTAIRSLLRPGRVVVVDEAFGDAVPEEAESMIGGDMIGLVVVRSLTKTWGLAGFAPATPWAIPMSLPGCGASSRLGPCPPRRSP